PVDWHLHQQGRPWQAQLRRERGRGGLGPPRQGGHQHHQGRGGPPSFFKGFFFLWLLPLSGARKARATPRSVLSTTEIQDHWRRISLQPRLAPSPASVLKDP